MVQSTNGTICFSFPNVLPPFSHLVILCNGSSMKPWDLISIFVHLHGILVIYKGSSMFAKFGIFHLKQFTYWTVVLCKFKTSP